MKNYFLTILCGNTTLSLKEFKMLLGKNLSKARERRKIEINYYEYSHICKNYEFRKSVYNGLGPIHICKNNEISFHVKEYGCCDKFIRKTLIKG